MRAAILDFGTNTFNLLIAEKEGNTFRVIFDGKEGVKLGKGGIHKGTISEEALERGFSAISRHMERINAHHVDQIHAYATSAIRNASNGKEFAGEVRKRFGFDIHIIDGEEEAALIYEGIRESVDFGTENVMIMDIGGGSIEFIICNSKGVLWKHSFELGMARIIEKFTLSDPIQAREKKAVEAYYREELSLLDDAVAAHHPSMLVGASGTFDTLAAMAVHKYSIDKEKLATSLELKDAYFNEIYAELLASTARERLAMPGMEPVRVEMIVPATIFISFVYKHYNLRSMRQSSYALKEGVMSRIVKA